VNRPRKARSKNRWTELHVFTIQCRVQATAGAFCYPCGALDGYRRYHRVPGEIRWSMTLAETGLRFTSFNIRLSQLGTRSSGGHFVEGLHGHASVHSRSPLVCWDLAVRLRKKQPAKPHTRPSAERRGRSVSPALRSSDCILTCAALHDLLPPHCLAVRRAFARHLFAEGARVAFLEACYFDKITASPRRARDSFLTSDRSPTATVLLSPVPRKMPTIHPGVTDFPPAPNRSPERRIQVPLRESP
jgi:hypothetical protein